MIVRIKQGQTAPFTLRTLSAKGAETETVFFTVQALASELANADTERVCISIPDTLNPEKVRAEIVMLLNRPTAAPGAETVKAVLQKSAEMRKRADAERAKVFHKKQAPLQTIAPAITDHRAFVCQHRPNGKHRFYFDGHTVPKFAWYGQMSDGTRFIAVKNGKQWGMLSHRGLEKWSQDIRMDILEFIKNTPLQDRPEVKYARTRVAQGQVIRKSKSHSRLPSAHVENAHPHGKMGREYKNLTIALYGETVDINGVTGDLRSPRTCAYMEGSGVGERFDISDYRPQMPQFPTKSGKRK